MEPKYRSLSTKHMLHLIDEYNVKLVDIWFVDISGRLKSLVVLVEHLESALSSGVVLNGASLIGPAGTAKHGIIALPDPDSIRVLPWRLHSPYARAGMFCNMLARGEPFEGDPRQVLRKNQKRAGMSHYTHKLGLTLELLLRPAPADPGAFMAATGISPLLADRVSSFRKELMLWLGAMGVNARCVVHGGDIGWQGVALSDTDALTMADNLVTLRLVIKELSVKNGLMPGFVANSFGGVGSPGLYLFQSLLRDGRDAFYDVEGTGQVSREARSCAASLLRHAAEIASVTGEPMFFGSGPVAPDGQSNLAATRIEIRSYGARYNPYLAFSLLLAAGLEGVQKPCEPGAGAGNKIGESAVVWPPGREQAIELLESSELAPRALGRTLQEAIITMKKIECEWPQITPDPGPGDVCRYLCSPDGVLAADPLW